MRGKLKARMLALATVCAFFASLTSAIAFALQRPAALTYDYGADTLWYQALEAAVEQAMDPTDYVCIAPTAFHLWINQQLQAI